MRLIFKQPYLSITQFADTEIADFTILTGLNGSGKSQLLQAIENKNVIIQGYENAKILRFTSESFFVGDDQPTSGTKISTAKDNAWKLFRSQIKLSGERLRKEMGSEYDQLKQRCIQDGIPIFSIRGNLALDKYKTSIANILNNLEDSSGSKAYESIPGIISLMHRLSFSIDELDHDDFISLFQPLQSKNDLLAEQIGQIVWNYYLHYERNACYQYQNEKRMTTHAVLSPNEFTKKHGAKPWEVLNLILDTFGSIDYRINSPEGMDIFGNYTLKLIHKTLKDVEVPFSSLSSGEKVLLAIVAAVYKASLDSYFPEILLFDEIDSTLHPSMIKALFNAINDTFLPRGTKIILVTHSPTTVALSPEKSVCVMNKSGFNRIEEKPNAVALGILTQGYVTLEQGMQFLDETARTKLTIVTEGRNSKLLAKACELKGYNDVSVIKGAEDVSGKTQLKTLYDFFIRLPHSKPVLFVLDCDVGNAFPKNGMNNTFCFVLPQNTKNTIAVSGIENSFSPELFEGFVKVIKPSIGPEIREFDKNRKKHFEEMVLSRNSLADFSSFETLFQFIEGIRGKTKD